jgi:hypothetical protein
MLTK